MLYHEGMTISRWLHCADGRATGHLAAGLWSTLLDGVNLEDALDVIVEHYRATDEMLHACDLLSRATVLGLLRTATTKELDMHAPRDDDQPERDDARGVA